MRQGKGIWF